MWLIWPLFQTNITNTFAVISSDMPVINDFRMLNLISPVLKSFIYNFSMWIIFILQITLNIRQHESLMFHVYLKRLQLNNF